MLGNEPDGIWRKPLPAKKSVDTVYGDCPVGQKRTCLDCGFLTIQGRELSRPQRIMLGTKGQSASMPANSEQTRCFKNLWDYDLIYSGNTFDGVVEEIEKDRNECPGFASYDAGFTPEQHLEHQIEERKEKLRWKIAKLGFLGALLGAILGTIAPKIPGIIKWLFEQFAR